MSEIPHTTGQINPTQYNGAFEITQEQILNASPENIIMAANGESERLQALLPTVEHEGVQWKSLRDQILTTSQVATQAREYKKSAHLTGSENFDQHLTTKMGDIDVVNVDDAEEFAKYQKVQDWLYEQASLGDAGAIGNVLRDKQEQQTTKSQPANQPEVHQTQDPQVEVAEQRQAIEDAHRSVESARSVELFDDIVKLSKNRTQLHTDVHHGFMEIGDAPRDATRLTSVHTIRQLFAREHKPADWRQELNEVVVFSDVVERETRQVTIPQQTKGRFGRTYTSEYTKTEAVPGSEHPKMIHNEINGQDEPAIRFRYNFDLRSGHAGRASQEGELPKYQEFGGHRNGQLVAVGMELAKSVADSLQAQLHRDPQSVRTLVEKLFLENSNGQMSEEHWRQGKEGIKHPVCPPYEQLPADWNIAFVTNQEGDGSNAAYTVERLQV